MIQRHISFAKINLFLHVTGKREDGYHNLCSLMTQIDLKDDIYIDFSSKNIQVECDYPGVPEDETNLAYKAAQLFFKSGKVNWEEECPGLGVRIEKQIPPGGGLGGGSSNAATVLMALNDHFENPFSKAELMKVGLQLGADVPFFIFGASAMATGVGEQLEKVEKLKLYHLVLCDPGVSASTEKVYKNIDFRLTTKSKYNMNTGLNVPLQGQDFDFRGQMYNDLMEPACRLYPEIKKTKEAMELLLNKTVFMTGSGAALFVLFSSKKNAQKGYGKLLEAWRGSKRKVFISSFK